MSEGNRIQFVGAKTQQVEVTAIVDGDGDVEIMANGHALCWLTAEGELMRRLQSGEDRAAIEAMGSLLDSEDCIQIYGAR